MYLFRLKSIFDVAAPRSYITSLLEKTSAPLPIMADRAFPSARTLKRKASQQLLPDNTDERDLEGQLLFTVPSDSISSWLSGVPTKRRCSTRRCHSDSALLQNMCLEQDGKIQLPSPRSQTPLAALAMLPPPAPSSRSGPSDPESGPSALSQASASKERVKNPAYRRELQKHRIFIRERDKSMPSPLRDQVDAVLQKDRDSPKLEATDIEKLEETLDELVDLEEANIRTSILQSCLLPNRRDYKTLRQESSICTGLDLLFDRTALPRTAISSLRLVSKPMPDWCLGYSSTVFGEPDSALQAALNHSRIRCYTQPTTGDVTLPWLSVEFKAPSRGGTAWVAENQNAGTGAHSVNSIETLLSWAGCPRPQNITDSISFSFVVVPQYATLWLHWREPLESGKFNFVSSKVHTYLFDIPDQLCDFQKHVHNIVDWGLSTRLEMIKDTLGKLGPVFAQLDAEAAAAAAARKRSRSQSVDSASGRSGGPEGPA